MRLVEDRLRAEYFALLPAMQRSLTAIEAEINYLLLPAKLKLDPHARILIRGRLKDCESAVDSLRRRQEGGRFDPAHPLPNTRFFTFGGAGKPVARPDQGPSEGLTNFGGRRPRT